MVTSQRASERKIKIYLLSLKYEFVLLFHFIDRVITVNSAMNKENNILNLFLDFAPVFGSSMAYCSLIKSRSYTGNFTAGSIDCNRSLDPKNEKETREQEGSCYDSSASDI